jgi:hypothetical protein
VALYFSFCISHRSFCVPLSLSSSSYSIMFFLSSSLFSTSYSSVIFSRSLTFLLLVLFSLFFCSSFLVLSSNSLLFFKNIFGGIFSFSFVLYSALLHLPPLRFHCADGCWDRAQDRCNWCIGCQTL